jgi:hypothetical protein
MVCYWKDLSCVEVLLSKGAQADTGCLKTTNTIELDFFKDGVTSYDSPLSVARKRKHLQIIKMIEKQCCHDKDTDSQMLHNKMVSQTFDTARKLICMEKELAQLRISSQRTGIQRYVRKRSELQAMSTCYLCLEGTQIGLAFLRATKHIREIQTS